MTRNLWASCDIPENDRCRQWIKDCGAEILSERLGTSMRYPNDVQFLIKDAEGERWHLTVANNPPYPHPRMRAFVRA